MKNYSVEPNKDAKTWLVKIEGVAPKEVYDNYNEAIEAAVNTAQDNKPSTLTILDGQNKVQEKRTFEST